MSQKYDYPTIVIGAGAGGLVVAIGSAKAGKKVLLIEKGTYGGDCTNFGCVPSKAMIASAHSAHALKTFTDYGLKANVFGMNSNGAFTRMRGIVNEILNHEDPPALESHGVDNLTGTAAFVDPHTLNVQLEDGSEKTVTGNQIVIATGSHPFIPPIKGINEVDYLTNETIFDLKEIPEHLVVMGGGPIGSELAQAFHRLGAKVSLIQRSEHILAKEDVDARTLMDQLFRKEGLELYTSHDTQNISQNGSTILLDVADRKTNKKKQLKATHLLISVGRIPRVEGLNLEKVGISTNKSGIIVDKYGRTKEHKHIWAVGDVAGRAIFTHVAENEGRTVLTNLLTGGFWKFKLDVNQAISRVTYTDPEVASIGLDEKHAIEKYGANSIACYTVPFTEVDRALTTGRTEGFAKIITKKWSSKILGAVIVSPRAGEMLSEVSLAMRARIPLRKLASLIHPYPTYSLAIRKCADQWLSKTILPSLKKLIGR